MTITATRKTFSGKGGRPRKEGPREKNGQPQRKSQKEIEQANMVVVLNQPHRRGSGFSWRETPIGRLLDDGRVKAPQGQEITSTELWRAAEEYTDAFRNIRRVWDSRRPWAVSSGRVPPDISDTQKARWESEWGDINRVLRDAGEMPKKAIEYVLQDAPPNDEERAYSFWVIQGLSVGLAALARHFGIVR